jgi:preprotein translocase SecF subunit
VANAQEKTESQGKDAPPPAAEKPAGGTAPAGEKSAAAPAPAGEKPAGGTAPGAEKSAPAPAPAGEKPAGTTPAASEKPAASPTPAVPPPAGTPASVGELVGSLDSEALRTAEARRLEVLQRMLQRENLLLPPPYTDAKWEDAGPAGAQRLVLGVNVVSIHPDFNEKALSTPETIAKRLNEFLERNPNSRMKDLRIETVEPVPPPPGATEKLQSFRIITRPFLAPLPGTDESTRTAPTHQEALAEIKRWFRTEASRQLTLSEPFPEVFSVGPKVAHDLQTKAIIAVFVSMVGIMFYMALRFELMYGLAGIFALFHDVLITIGIMAMTDTFLGQVFSLKINLPEIAAFLTIIGFSINDTIVVFDRIREILKTPRRKLEFTEVVNAAVNQTLSRTIWTSLTTLLVTIALLLFGGEPIRGFSFAFAVGVVTGCYSSVFIANPFVVWLHDRQVKRREALLAEEAKA